MGFLSDLQPGEIIGQIYWCYRERDGSPDKPIQALVSKHHGKLIPILGFDEFMFQLGERFG